VGISVLGSIGLAVYRSDVAQAMPAGVGPGDQERALATLGDALAVAAAIGGHFPDGPGVNPCQYHELLTQSKAVGGGSASDPEFVPRHPPDVTLRGGYPPLKEWMEEIVFGQQLDRNLSGIGPVGHIVRVG
jgi:hypothetical protein